MNWKVFIFIIIIIILIFFIFKNKNKDNFTSISCEDTDSKCNDYDESECVSNPLYMMDNCPKKCGMCNLTDNARNAIINNGNIAKDFALGQCIDISNKCQSWLNTNPNECQNTSSYMRQYCKNTCGFCDVVENIDGKLTKFPNNVYQDQYNNQNIAHRSTQAQTTNLFSLLISRDFLNKLSIEDENICKNFIEQTILPNLTIYSTELENIGKQIGNIANPITDEESNIISNNIAQIINLYNSNATNILNNCTSSNRIKNELGNTDPDYQKKIELLKLGTNIFKNIKKIILSNETNYTNIIKVLRNIIIDYNNKLSTDINIKEMTDFTNSLNDLVDTFTTKILKIQ